LSTKSVTLSGQGHLLLTNRNGEEGAKGRKEVPLHVSLFALFAFAVKNSSIVWQVPAFGK
jgi:hypothetical protein